MVMQRKLYNSAAFGAAAVMLLSCSGASDANRKEIEALRAELQQLKAEVSQRPPAGATERGPSERDLLGKIEREYRQRFEKAPPNLAYTKTAVERFSALPGAQAMKIECRNDLCVLDTTFRNEAAFVEFKTKGLFGLRAAWQGGFTIVRADPAPDGSRKVTVYLEKEPAQRLDLPPEDPPCECLPKAPASAKPKAG
jgi:hypothetical protein